MLKRLAFWTVFFFCQLMALALLGWHLLAQCDFAYPVGYQLLGLDQHIEKYAPLNRYKVDFAATTAQDHWRLFAEIGAAVQSGGAGLAQISYPLKSGVATPLMRQPEVLHLQDVADLIDAFYLAGTLCALCWLALIFLARRRRMALPAPKKILAGFLSGLALLAAATWLAGPEKVFYDLHTLVFPPGHQWFFFYEESLMTTLMKAPDIFAFIAIVLLVLLVGLWCAAVLGLRRLLRRPAGMV